MPKTPLLILLGVLLWSSLAFAQPTPCAAALSASYEGPCYYGVLPAFFDDFEYSSARSTGPLTRAPQGDIFGANVWHERQGTTTTRAWYRFNRDDLDIPGAIAFSEPSVLELRLPAGLDASDYTRALALSTDVTALSGTYVWRVRLSALGEEQRVRQAVWTMSPTIYVFDRRGSRDASRFSFWSELDFENENHFQGEHSGSVFVPDFVTRMSVGNHYGKAEDRYGSHRLGRSGARGWSDASGTLARNGPGRGGALDAPLLSSWANTWLYLMAEVDAGSETVTYRMVPERRDGELRALSSRSITVGADFFPREPMHLSLSLHWIEPAGRLLQPLYLEADWAYVAPIPGLSLETVRTEVARLRRQGISRLNTTGQTTFEGFARGDPMGVGFSGPRHVACGKAAAWDVHIARMGRYHLTVRYRLLPHEGPPGPWEKSFTPTLTLTPRPGQRGVELEATARDEWAPHGTIVGPGGRPLPNPANDTERARFTARFACAP